MTQEVGRVVGEMIYKARYPQGIVQSPPVQPGYIAGLNVHPAHVAYDNQYLVTQVIFENGRWKVNMQNIGSVSSDEVRPIGWSNSMPDVLAGEVHDIEVIEPPNTLEKVVALLRGAEPQSRTKKVGARVLTQSALTRGSFVYLTDPQAQEVYVVPSTTLLKHLLQKGSG